MPGLTPRRVAGPALRMGVRVGRLPVIGAGIRAGVRSSIGVERLRSARLGTVPPLLVPDADDGASQARAGAAVPPDTLGGGAA